MSRYSRGRVGLTRDKDERSSIGENYMEQALVSLNAKQQRAVGYLTNYTHTVQTTVEMLFPPDIIARALNAKGIIKPETPNIRHYNLLENVAVSIDYTNHYVPAIQPKQVALQPSAHPLLDHIAAVAKIHWAYEEVRGVLKWLNRNATPGAIRYYWPSALKLTQNSPAWKGLEGVPTRFTEPLHINQWQQNLKDAAATCTAMLMLPDEASTKPRERMWLTFDERKVVVGDGSVSYVTDAVTYNL